MVKKISKSRVLNSGIFCFIFNNSALQYYDARIHIIRTFDGALKQQNTLTLVTTTNVCRVSKSSGSAETTPPLVVVEVIFFSS